MLTCVCRPVSSSFVDKQSIMGAPIDRDQIVVTSEPKTKVGTAKAIVNPNPQVHAWMCCLLHDLNFPARSLFAIFRKSNLESVARSRHVKLSQLQLEKGIKNKSISSSRYQVCIIFRDSHIAILNLLVLRQEENAFPLDLTWRGNLSGRETSNSEHHLAAHSTWQTWTSSPHHVARLIIPRILKSRRSFHVS